MLRPKSPSDSGQVIHNTLQVTKVDHLDGDCPCDRGGNNAVDFNNMMDHLTRKGFDIRRPESVYVSEIFNGHPSSWREPSTLTTTVLKLKLNVKAFWSLISTCNAAAQQSWKVSCQKGKN